MSVLRTSDGGSSWVKIPAPPTTLTGSSSSVDDLRFANAKDGFAYGRGAIWKTTDGGANWQLLPSIAGMAPCNVNTLQTTSTGVCALVSSGDSAGPTGNNRLVFGDPATNAFRVVYQFQSVPGEGALANAGDALYAIDGDILVRATEGGNTVTTASVPANQNCHGPVAASSPTDLLLLCGSGVGGGGMGQRLAYGSTNSRTTWVPLPDPGIGAGYDTSGVVDTSGGHAAIGTESVGGSGVLITSDYAQHWALTLNFPSDIGIGLVDLAFQDVDDDGVVIHGPYVAVNGVNVNGVPLPAGSGVLFRTTDGGLQWSQVTL